MYLNIQVRQEERHYSQIYSIASFISKEDFQLTALIGGWSKKKN